MRKFFYSAVITTLCLQFNAAAQTRHQHGTVEKRIPTEIKTIPQQAGRTPHVLTNRATVSQRSNIHRAVTPEPANVNRTLFVPSAPLPPGLGIQQLYIYNWQQTVAANHSFLHQSFAASTCDTILLTRQSQIDSFPILFPTCTQINVLQVDGENANPAITNLNGLAAVTHVADRLIIRNTSLTDLSQLSSLTHVDTLTLRNNLLLTSTSLSNLTELNSIDFRNQPMLSSIAGLTDHITSTGDIEIDTSALTSLAGLAGLTTINGSLNIRRSPIPSLADLNNHLTSVGYINLEGNPQMTTVGLTSLTHMDGLILWEDTALVSLGNITGNLTNGDNVGSVFFFHTKLANLNGMEGVTHILNTFIAQNHQMTSLHGFHNLAGDIPYGLSVVDNENINDLSALSGIQTVLYGGLEVTASSLTSLSDLVNITEVGGAVRFNNNPNLTSLDGLNNTLQIDGNRPNPDENICVITDNPQLAFCSSTPLCSFLSNGGQATVFGNASGCESTTALIANCVTFGCSPADSARWIGSTDGNWDNTSNWNTGQIPGSCTVVTIPGDPDNYPQLNNDINIGGLIMQENAQLYGNFKNMYVKNVLNLNSASLNDINTLFANRVYHPQVFYSYIGGEFQCTNFGGASDFVSSQFDGNVLLSDSAGRSERWFTYFNEFYQDLTIVNNSEYGNTYLSNASPFYDHVYGNLTVQNNSSAGISVGLGGDRPLKVQGDLTIESNDGDINIHTYTCTGSGQPHMRHFGSGSLRMDNLYMENSGGGTVILDNPLEINDEIHFNAFSGCIRTASDKLLIIKNNAVATHDFSPGFVQGPIKKIGSQDFTFPAGALENNTLWSAPISISAPQNDDDEFTAEYFHHSPGADGYDTSSYAAGFGHISGKEYWMLNRNNGSSVVTVTLAFDSARSGTAYDLNQLQIAGWEAGQWKSRGNGGTTGAVYNGTVQSSGIVPAYGPFTFSTKPIRKPIITLQSIGDSVKCAGQYYNLPYTLDTLALTGNVFRVELSDSAGHFSTGSNPSLGSLSSSALSGSVQFFLPSVLFYGHHYKIRLVGNLLPDTSVNTLTIIPTRIPQQVFTLSGPSPVCITGNAEKYYPNLHEAGADYQWTLSGGGSLAVLGDTALITWTTPGNYTVTLHTHNVCGFGPSQVLPVTVLQPAPAAAPTITNNGRWLYTTVAPAGQTIQWYRNNTVIPGETGLSYYASQSGTYTVKYVNSCGESPASNNINFPAAAQPQTISFPAISDKNFGDASFALGASASSGLTVSYEIVSGPGSLAGNIYTITDVGTVTVRATQAGSNIYDTAAPVTRTFTVNPGTQTISFAALADQVYGAAPFSLSASASSGLPVSFTVTSGPATLTGNLVTLTGIGTVTLTASQAGDSHYSAAPNVIRTFCVTLASLNPISGNNNICPGTTVNYSVNNVPGGVYNWRLTNGTTFPSSANTASVTWSTAGTYTLLVSVSGNCGAPSVNDTLIVHVINPVTPGAVTNMLPANGAVNQQLPLTLSWLPGTNALNYDLYVWDSAGVQPSAPFAADITGVSYTITNGSLIYNKAYKWRIISKNACLETAGPIQTFRLIPLPDLKISNVQVPATAFSGQTISVSWTVTNLGPGNTNTNQSWTDAVFLSFDTMPNFSIPPNTNSALWSILDFPVKTLIIGAKPNVTALDSGQHYTNSINFTLPVSYSLPVYAYVITNYQPGSNAPLEMTYINDTARSPQPVNVTLSPTPDLRVDTVFTPLSTFTGSTINVTYKVKNYGVLTPAGANWTDKIYISQSPFFDVNTAQLLKLEKPNGTYYPDAQDAVLNNNTQLKADSFYTKTAQAVIPNFISAGNYFIYVKTNATNSLYEAAFINNNTNSNVIQVFLTPTPDLTVSSLSVPVTTASTTQPLGINWNIFNAGFYDNIEKNKGHYFVQNGTCTIPPPPCSGPPGTICTPPPPTPGRAYRDSLGFGSSWWVDKIYLSTDASSLNTATARLVGTFSHGYQNQGLTSPENLQSIDCQLIGADVSGSNKNVSPAINAGSNFPASTTITMPDDLPAGNYYIYVYTNPDKTVFEYPDVPRTKRSNLPVTVQRPDISVPTVLVPSTAVGGQAITIHYDLLNNGAGTVFSHLRKDKIYVSNSPSFDGSAQLISTQTYTEDLPVGTAVSHSLSYSFPAATSGTRYFYVHANFDSSFRETTYGNNISAAASVAVTTAVPADLVVSNISIADTVRTLFAGKIKYSVINNGTGTATGNHTDSVFVSCNNSFSYATAAYIGSALHAETLATGQSYTDSIQVNIPLAWMAKNCFPVAEFDNAYFFIKVNADNNVYEGSNTINNTGNSGIRVLANPLVDHIVTTVNGGDTAIVARPYAVNWTVKNTGAAVPTGPDYYYWYDVIYFSPDSVLNSNAVQANFYTYNSPLGHNQSYSDTKNIITPNIPTGDYYVLVKTNNYNQINAEINLSNNINLIRNGAGAAKKIHVVQPLLPDLTDTIIYAPASIAVGQPLKVIHRATNNGAGATYPDTWSHDYLLSTDFIPNNGNDILLGGTNHTGSLAPGQSYTDSITAQIPLNAATGNYILISRENANGGLFESNTNNNLAFSYITVYRPAPSDLIVQNVIHPDTVYLGYTMDTAKWIISNQSPNNAAGYSSDGIYLSKHTTLDSTAVLAGILNKNLNMAPLTNDTLNLRPMISSLTEGNYNMLVKTDLLNNIFESDKTNNTGISSSPVYVKVKELPLDVLTPNTLSTVNRFYKLVIPDTLRGSTILVTLKSNDSASVKNQMYVGLGYVPTAAHFDYAYAMPNYGNQEIVLTSVEDSVYYITISCVTPNPPTQNITLKAVKLPFAILNVNASSGGNTGNVTVKISGSLFAGGMTARLTKPGTTISSSSVYFVNSTTVYATFNLQGKPLGIYDVTLSKADTALAVLASSFSIVNTNNGGLNNGGGTNSGQSGSGNDAGCDPGAAGGLNSQLVTELVIPDRAVGGWAFTIQINYNNPTNVDIPAQTRVLYSADGLPVSFTQAGLNTAGTSLYLTLTEQNGPPGIIRAGGSGTITVYSKAPVTYPAHSFARFILR